MNLYENFSAWLYQNYTVCNGHQLVALLEDEVTFGTYLEEMGLPEDTEMEY